MEINTSYKKPLTYGLPKIISKALAALTEQSFLPADIFQKSTFTVSNPYYELCYDISADYTVNYTVMCDRVERYKVGTETHDRVVSTYRIEGQINASTNKKYFSQESNKTCTIPEPILKYLDNYNTAKIYNIESESYCELAKSLDFSRGVKSIVEQYEKDGSDLIIPDAIKRKAGFNDRILNPNYSITPNNISVNIYPVPCHDISINYNNHIFVISTAGNGDYVSIKSSPNSPDVKEQRKKSTVASIFSNLTTGNKIAAVLLFPVSLPYALMLSSNLKAQQKEREKQHSEFLKTEIPDYLIKNGFEPPVKNQEQTDTSTVEKLSRSKKNIRIYAALCAFSLGCFGLHKRLIGKKGAAEIMAATTILTCGFGMIYMTVISLIEGWIYLKMSDEDFEKIYLNGSRQWL